MTRKRMSILLLVLLVSLIISSIFQNKWDFREAILEHDMRIRLNGKNINEHQQFFWAEKTYVIGIFYNEQWNKRVITRNRMYRKIKDTPYSVKINESIVIRKDDIRIIIHKIIALISIILIINLIIKTIKIKTQIRENLMKAIENF